MAAVAALLSLVVTAAPEASAQPSSVYECNERLGIQVDQSGNSSFGAFPTPGDCQPGPSTYALSNLYPSYGGSYASVMVDGQVTAFHSGTLTVPPTAQGGSIFMEMTFGDISVGQLMQISANPETGEADMARVYFIINNDSPDQHDVGIRYVVDTQIDESFNPTIFVNDQAVTTETEYVGSVPESFTVQHDSDPSRAAFATLGGSFGESPANRLIIADQGSLAGSAWDFPLSARPLNDSAFAAYWETPQLFPNNQLQFTMSYGLGVGGQGGSPIPGCEPTTQNQCGTTGDDNLSASDGTVVAGPGDDTIILTVDETTNSLTVDGGTGADEIVLNIEDPSNISAVKLNSGDGPDQIFVPSHPGALSPVINTGGSNDVVRLNTVPSRRIAASLQDTPVGRYSINAGAGNDRVSSGTSDDLLNGAGGHDRLLGAAGLDKIEGGNGNDDMLGGDGADTLHGGDGVNGFAGGPGRDTCLSDTRRDSFNSCERIRRNHRRNHQAI
jgi:Ca2+-binding RTX toxin-like protein